MRRLMLSAMSALLVLSFATQAFAGWGHFVGLHHWHRGHHHVRHHGWYGGHRHYVGHHHWYRPYVHRHYVHRYYSYPSFGFNFYRVPTYRYYAPVRYYYSYPYCVSSVTPSYSTTRYSYSLAARTPTRVEAPRVVESAPAAPAWAALADRLVKRVAERRDDPPLRLVARSREARRERIDREPVAGAERVIELGDGLFRDGRYEQARAYYESASKMTSSSADAHFRHGQACIATGQYDDAVAAFKQGLATDPAFLHSSFRLQDIYGNSEVKSQHVETLAAAALEKANDSDLLFLIGAFLHFEGKSDRAEKFLNRAADLAGKEASHIHQFLYAGKTAAPLRLTSDFSSWSETAGPF